MNERVNEDQLQLSSRHSKGSQFF